MFGSLLREVGVMPVIPESYADMLQGAAEHLKESLRAENEDDAKLVQKGLLLYRQGLVSKVRYEKNSLFATVQDVVPVYIELDLIFPQLSECSCPSSENFCRHQLAAFFSAYSQIGSVAEWVEEWRQPLKEKKSAQQWGIQRAKDLLRASGALKTDYEQWIESFEESFDSILKGQGKPRPYIIPELYQIYNRKINAGAPVEREWKQLYYLIGYITTFRKLLQLTQELGHHQEDINRFYRQIFHSLIDDIEVTIDRLSVHALPFAFDQFIEKLKNDSSFLLTEELELEYERTQLYLTLWNQLFKKKNWRVDEIEKLKNTLKRMDALPLHIGIVHLHLLLREDTEALQTIKALKGKATPYMLFWLDLLRVQKEVKRMDPIIEEFISQLRPYLAELEDTYACFDFSRWALKVITAYCTETNKMDLYEKALLQTLPYSYRDYDDFLFSQKSYDKWGELHAFIGFGLESISNEKIKQVQKDDPVVLLPLFHQSVQKHIALKNRGNYRQAVRELKKIRTIYKKLKRQDEWEQFFEGLLIAELF